MGSSLSHIRFLQPLDLRDTGYEGYLKILLREGSQSLVENAIAEVKVVGVDDKILPVLIVDSTSRNCDLCSTLAHHVKYAKDEICLRSPELLKSFVGMAYAAFDGLLRLGRIDNVVFLDNWLFSTNPCLDLNTKELESIRRFIQRYYPNHAQVIKSVHPSLFPKQKKIFLDCDFSLFKSRDIFIWPANDDGYLARSNFHKDSKLLMRSQYKVVSAKTMRPEEARWLRHLYCGLYLKKHNPLNGWLTEKFFETTFRNQTLTYHVLTCKEQIAGFYSFCIVKDIFLVVAIGYDLTISKKEGIYRQLIASCIHEAKKRNVTLNLSAGVDAFKTLRGGRSIIEYEAVYHRHLSLRQRIAWSLLKLKCSLSIMLRSLQWNSVGFHNKDNVPPIQRVRSLFSG